MERGSRREGKLEGEVIMVAGVIVIMAVVFVEVDAALNGAVPIEVVILSIEPRNSHEFIAGQAAHGLIDAGTHGFRFNSALGDVIGIDQEAAPVSRATTSYGIAGISIVPCLPAAANHLS